MKSPRFKIVLSMAAFLSIAAVMFGMLSRSGFALSDAEGNELEAVVDPIGCKSRVDKPPMDAIQALREHVAVCESLYKRIRTLCEHQARGGEVVPQLKIYYHLRMARAELCRAEKKWKECVAEASEAVAAAETLLETSLAHYEMDDDSFLPAAENSKLLTEARLLLAKAATKAKPVGKAALDATNSVVADDSQDKTAKQWGPEKDGLRTRLTPAADHFTLGQPMLFRLELKNVGKKVAHYSAGQVDINGSLEVRDPQGRPVHYTATSFQTMSGKPPALTPNNIVVLFDDLDMNTQYLIVKPGKYTVKLKGYSIPQSNTVAVEIRPGTLPPIKRIAARLQEVMPDNWEITVHGYDNDSDRSRPADWDDPVPGWGPVRGMPIIQLRGIMTPYKGGSVNATLWLSNRKLKWTGKVAYPAQKAAVYYGKCPEGHIYAMLPSTFETEIAKWQTFAKDLEKAIQAEQERSFPVVREMKTDDDLKNSNDLSQKDSLFLDCSKISDAGLKHLEGLTRLKTLWLRHTRITDRGLQSLTRLPHLEYLWLDGDNITDAGVDHIKGMPKLKYLSLDETKITDAGLEKLKGLTQLEGLSLDETKITDAGMETVKGMTKLESLSLDGTKITDAGLEKIKGLKEIERLSLAHTHITDAGLEHLKGLTKLVHLDIDETNVTDEGVGRLQRLLPDCELYYKSEAARRERY